MTWINDCIILPFQNHADLGLQNYKDETALDLASQYGRLSTVNLICLNFFILKIKSILLHALKRDVEGYISFNF